MAPTDPKLLELEYAVKLLAKTLDEVDEKAASAITKLDAHHETVNDLKEALATVDKKLELLPLVLAAKIEPLIEKRTHESYEDLRTTLDEMRNKLWAIRKQQKDTATGSHLLPTAEQLAQWEGKKKEEDDGISVRKGKFRMDLPISEGSLRILKWVGIIILALAGVGGASGGIWALVDRLKHLGGGG